MHQFIQPEKTFKGWDRAESSRDAAKSKKNIQPKHISREKQDINKEDKCADIMIISIWASKKVHGKKATPKFTKALTLSSNGSNQVSHAQQQTPGAHWAPTKWSKVNFDGSSMGVPVDAED